MAQEKEYYEKQVEERLPEDKLISAHRATILSVKEDEDEGQEERGIRVFPNTGDFVVTDQHLVFVADKSNFTLVMAALAVLFLAFAVILLFTSFSLTSLTIVGILFLSVSIAEAFLFFEQKNSGFIALDRSTASVTGSKETGELLMESPEEGNISWLARKRSYKVQLEAGEKFPEL